MVGVALLGAGIFARNEHLPAILATPELELKAIYSRSQSSAQNLAGSLPKSDTPPVVYFDSPSVSGSSLDDLLARKDIDAVIVCLPILAQPDIIRKAWKAGKHVLSEKPIAKDICSAKALLEEYHALPDPKPVWAVAENYRFQECLKVAGQKLKDVGGELILFSFDMSTLVKTDNKYFNTAWRKVPEYQGGFLLDGGVHFTAALRYLLAAANDKITSVKASTSLLQPFLPPLDTIHGIVNTAGGRSGSFNVSFGNPFRSGFRLAISTTNGEVEMNPSEVKVTTLNSAGEKSEELITINKTTGVHEEVKAWAVSLRHSVVRPDQSPEEALCDLAVLEGLLKAGETHACEAVDA
ncbi:hypothetical protein BROUX41_002718 [Berkeleyomyces rouxiae]|uniref:uncharacterized protein n=1 Tax=Berkeleyomyces rouxiae TaxID=2035830 RepID=UPI003B78AB00